MSLLDLYETRDICQIFYNKDTLKVCIYLLKGESSYVNWNNHIQTLNLPSKKLNHTTYQP